MDKEGVKVGRYTYYKSTRSDKKLMTRVDGKLIHFGNPFYEHYKDRTGIWKQLNHNDKKRQDQYVKRHSAILDKDGYPVWLKNDSPAYHAMRILWL